MASAVPRYQSSPAERICAGTGMMKWLRSRLDASHPSRRCSNSDWLLTATQREQVPFLTGSLGGDPIILALANGQPAEQAPTVHEMQDAELCKQALNDAKR